MDNIIIGFAGLTHLGINSLAAAAEKGFEVVGFDENQAKVDALNQGDVDVNENGLVHLLEKNNERISFTSSLEDLAGCDLVYISVDVPTDDKAISDLKPIETIINNVLEIITADTVLVVLCQVPPGFTRNIQRRHTNTYYQVETLIFGRAIERAMYPERYILGCSNTCKVHPNVLRYLESYNCPILPMRFESAELCKTAINLFLAASVSTANSIAEICEKIGADWSEIIPSLRLDRRIGEHAYIETGLGLSGGNIERDLRTVQLLAKTKGTNSSVIDSFIAHSRVRKRWLVDKFQQYSKGFKNNPNVGVLGLSYKENTHSIKNSPSIDFLSAINGHNINVYDPVVKSLSTDLKINHCSDAYEAATNADILLINTAWDQFRSLDPNRLVSVMRSSIIIDPFCLLSDKLENNVTHITLGK